MSWSVIIIVAIIVWGVVQLAKARAGIISDVEGNETYVGTNHSPQEQARIDAEVQETRREIEQLRERLHVLERIATDENTLSARERARIAAEIEALRGPSEPSISAPPSLTADSSRKEPDQ